MTGTIKRIKKNSSIIAIVTLFISCQNIALCQQYKFPEVGKKCPPFKFMSVDGTPNQVISLDNEIGNYLILDFWTIGCTSCISSFPKLDSLQRKFKGKLKVILVGLEDAKRDVKKYYKKYGKERNINLTSVYDSVYFRKMVPREVPHYIWIDKHSIVRAITSINDVNDRNIQHFVAGKKFKFIDRSHLAFEVQKSEVDHQLPLLINGNGGADNDYLYRSILAKWEPGKGRAYIPNTAGFTIKDRRVMYQAIAAPLRDLYMVAYFGVTQFMSRYPCAWPWPIINTKDSLRFKSNLPNSIRFNYCLEAPSEKANTSSLTKMMREDLNKYFGYDARITEKQMPCLKLIIVDSTRAKRAMQKKSVAASTWNQESTTNTLSNIALDNLPSILTHKLHSGRYVTQNATGLSDNVSLTIDGNIENLNEIRESLKKYGFDLIMGEKIFDVLVINDPKPEIRNNE